MSPPISIELGKLYIQQYYTQQKKKQDTRWLNHSLPSEYIEESSKGRLLSHTLAIKKREKQTSLE